MPDSRKLYQLASLRHKAGVTLAEMARVCGLGGRRAYESASAWERGQSIPHKRLRPGFVEYTAITLGLHRDSVQLRALWDVLADEWNWDSLRDDEWQHTILGDLASQAGVAVASSPLRIHQGVQSHISKLPTKNIPLAGSLPPGSRMPYVRNPSFVGRNDDLRSIAVALGEGNTTVISSGGTAAATGMGGIGKTQLAVEFVHRYGQFFAGGVFWLSFADPTSVAAEVAACGGADYMALQPDFGKLSLGEQVRLVRARWEEATPKLLVFDNCENPELVMRWRPQSKSCSILLTSRRTRWEAKLNVWTLPLPTLPRVESLALLQKHCPDILTHDLSAIAIAAELDDLPLALHLAGSFLARYRDRVSSADYLQQLRGLSEGEVAIGTYGLFLQHSSLQGQGISPTGHAQNVARTFALSYEQLDPSYPVDQVALAMLARMVRFALGEPVSRTLVEASVSSMAHVSESEHGITRLVELGLIEESAVHETLRVHRLIAAYVQQVTPESEARTAQSDVERVLLESVRLINMAENHKQMLALQTHLRTVTDAALRRRDIRAAELCHELGAYLFQIDELTETQHYLEQSISIRSEVLGEYHVSLAPSLHQLAWLYDSSGRTALALPLHRHALTIRRAGLGNDDPILGESLNYVGTVLHAQGKFVEAEQYYAEALALRVRLLGEAHPDTAQSLNNLGLLLIFCGKYVEAESYLRRAVAIREQSPKINRSKLVIALNNMGYLLRKMARYREAQSYLERSLTMRQELYGSDHSYIAVSLNHLGRLLHAQGEYTGARQHLERVIAIRQVTLPDSEWLANSLSNLGMLCFDQGQHNKARHYIAEALAMHQRVWGNEHWHTARSLNHLGILLLAVGQVQEAQQHLAQALSIRERVLGLQHPNTANTLAYLAMILREQGRLGEALPLAERALAIHYRALGPDHPYTARTLMFLALIQQNRSEHQIALTLLREALAIYNRSLGKAHPYTLACSNRLVELIAVERRIAG